MDRPAGGSEVGLVGRAYRLSLPGCSAQSDLLAEHQIYLQANGKTGGRLKESTGGRLKESLLFKLRNTAKEERGTW